MMLRTSFAGATDAGRRRPDNEDAFLLLDDALLFAVADGVGGHAGGEVASGIAVETVREIVPAMLGMNDRTPPAAAGAGADREPAALRYAVALANRRVLEAVQHRPELAGMATTLTALLFSQARVHLAHLGDSRAYRLRSGTLRQLSEDHSLVAVQVKAGVLTPGQARTSVHRHVITRALGMAEDVGPDLQALEVRAGDVYLLCTDGLTEMVEDREIGKLLASTEPETAVRKLISAANGAGGVDNITAVVVKVLEV